MGWLSQSADVSVRAARAARKTALCAAAAICGVFAAPAERALAADMPDVLRGSLSPGYARWDGWQFGVQAGAANLRTDFANSTSSIVAFILRNTVQEDEFHPSGWTALSPGTKTGSVVGAFLGYNMQWERLVLGWDLGYNYASNLATGAGDFISRQFVTSDQFDNQVTINGQATMKLLDYATLRARAGYAYGQFLPYAAVGLAVGRFSYATIVTVHSAGQPIPPAPGVAFDNTDTQGVSRTGAITGGVSGAIGMDWAITPGLFLRGEWQYVAFGPLNGTRSNVNTGSLGIGARF